MLVIRFQRVGRKNDPAFRIVVTEKQNAAKKKHLEILGSYYPKTKHTVLKAERIKYWLSKGVQLSDTAHNLLVRNKVIEAKPRLIKMKQKTETAAVSV